MKKTLNYLALVFMIWLLAACGPAPAVSLPDPEPAAVIPPTATPVPSPVSETAPKSFPESPCVELKVKLISGKTQRYNLKLFREKESWSLVLTDYPGSILEPGTHVFVSGTEAKDLPFERFLEVFRFYHAEAWDGWETPAGEESFALELLFADGTCYSASGGEAPEGFAAFREALVREMARFGEDWCGLEPQTVQERLLNTCSLNWGDGSLNDIYVAARATLPLWENGAMYHSPTYWPEKHDLSPFLGDWLLDHEEMSWYRVKGMKGLKYLISRDGEGGLRLWEYRYRIQEDWEEPQSMEDLLYSVYGVEGPEDLRRIVVTQGRFRYRDPSLSRTIEDRESIEAFWTVISGLNWSNMPYEWKAYDFPEYTYSFTLEDGNWPPETEYLSQRAITLVFADGTTMEDWHYNAVFGYLERVYGHGEHIQPDEPLPPEDVYTLNALFGIA